MIDIQLYRARIGVFTFKIFMVLAWKEAKEKKDINLIAKGASK